MNYLTSRGAKPKVTETERARADMKVGWSLPPMGLGPAVLKASQGLLAVERRPHQLA
jgi:hypothetical protein